MKAMCIKTRRCHLHRLQSRGGEAGGSGNSCAQLWDVEGRQPEATIRRPAVRADGTAGMGSSGSPCQTVDQESSSGRHRRLPQVGEVSGSVCYEQEEEDRSKLDSSPAPQPAREGAGRVRRGAATCPASRKQGGKRLNGEHEERREKRAARTCGKRAAGDVQILTAVSNHGVAAKSGS